jgi:hypothetical protein
MIREGGGIAGAPNWVKPTSPDRTEVLTSSLYEKAKREFSFRFYSLYDKLSWMGKAFQSIEESMGAGPWPDSLTEDLHRRAMRRPEDRTETSIPAASLGRFRHRMAREYKYPQAASSKAKSRIHN